MVTIHKNNSPLVQRPLKTSQATGASLATMGIANSIPLMHGSQGCGAFAKVYLIQHFREPMPIQNTAIDHISAVMGGDESLQSALALLCEKLCEKHTPSAITVMSTGLTEIQGTDLQRNVREFRQAKPEYDHIKVVFVPTPDFVGSLQSGFALTIDSYCKQLLSDFSLESVSKIPNQINVLCSSMLSTADIELMKSYFDAFGLNGIFLPDVSLSVDGHLAEGDYSATSTGGCDVSAIENMRNSAATIVLGESLNPTGQWLAQQFNMPCYCLDHLYGLTATDELVMLLKTISGIAVPEFLQRKRKRLQDSLLDCHFVLSNIDVGAAVESDQLQCFDTLLAEAGCQLIKAVTCNQSYGLKKLHAEQVVIGDHSALDEVIDKVQLLIGNTHCAEFFEQQVPVYRAGYPCHDRFGNSDRLLLGYEGARAFLNEIANLVLANQPHSVAPYQSPYHFSETSVTVKSASNTASNTESSDKKTAEQVPA